MRARLTIPLLLVSVLAASGARAQPAPSPPAPTASSEAEQAYARHMALGIRLFEDRNYDAAMTEFERAYEKVKKASPLINIALCHKGRFQYTKAIVALEAALRDHRASIDDPAKIERAIAEMKELLGTLVLKITPRDASPRVHLRLDEDDLAQGIEAKPIDVNPGHHSLTIEAEGFATVRRDFRIASGDSASLSIVLVHADGSVAIHTHRDDTSISVDGERVGGKSYEGRLKPGMHQVEITWPARRHSANFYIASGKKTSIEMDEYQGLLVTGSRRRSPETLPAPPVHGFYAIAFGEAGVKLGDVTSALFGWSVRSGYRIVRRVGVELEVRGVASMADNGRSFEDGSTESRDIGLQIRALTRVMSPSEGVRAVGSFGVGYTYEAVVEKTLADTPTGHGFCAVIEPGVEIDLKGLILGLHTPFAFSIGGVGSFAEFSAGVQIGYGAW